MVIRSAIGRIDGTHGAAAAFGVAVLGSALAIGALHTRVLVVVSALIAIAFALSSSMSPLHRIASRARPVLWVGIALTAYTAFQCVPLPVGVVKLLSPEGADAWVRALAMFNEVPKLAPLTVDPPATHVEVLKGVTYLLAFVTTLRIASRSGGSRIVVAILVGSPFVVALIAIGSEAVGARTVLGVYTPERGYAHIATLLNRNHFCAYLNVGCVVAFGTVLRAEPGVRRSVYWSAAFLLGLASLWGASRAGVASLVLALMACWAWGRAGRSESKLLGWTSVAVLAATLGTGMLIFATDATAWSDLTDREVSKLRFAIETLRAVPRFFLTGAGRGAFASVFPLVQTIPLSGEYTWPEFIASQWCVEWGVPISIAAASALLWAFRPSIAVSGRGHAVGPYCALLCLAIHNLADYNSEVPAIGVVGSACAALVFSRHRSRDDSHAPEQQRRGASIARVIVQLVAIACGLVFVWRESTVSRVEDRLAMRELASEASTDVPTFMIALRGAILRHPAEPYLPLMGAQVALRHRDLGVVRWVGHTLERASLYSAAHLLLARHLRATNPAQARFEYRLAAEMDPMGRESVLTELLPLLRSYDDVRDAVPRGKSRASVLEYFASNLGHRLPASVQRIDDELIVLDPKGSGSLERRGRALVEELALGPAAPDCFRDCAACSARGAAIARSLVEQDAGYCLGHVLTAQFMAARGDVEAAFAKLAESAMGVRAPDSCLRDYAEAAFASGSDAVSEAAVDSTLRAGCLDASFCVETLRRVSSWEVGRGRLTRALSLLKRASDISPDPDALLTELAEAAMRFGHYAQAYEVYHALAMRRPEQPNFAADAERARLNWVSTAQPP